eukprot:SAG22_NODE_1040_length_5886_cov_3.559855_6_plen_104_part_00
MLVPGAGGSTSPFEPPGAVGAGGGAAAGAAGGSSPGGGAKRKLPRGIPLMEQVRLCESRWVSDTLKVASGEVEPHEVSLVGIGDQPHRWPPRRRRTVAALLAR